LDVESLMEYLPNRTQFQHSGSHCEDKDNTKELSAHICTRLHASASICTHLHASLHKSAHTLMQSLPEVTV
jgi:hypothetical protein